MSKSFVLGSFFAAFLTAGAAHAAVLPVAVSATGSFNGNIAVLTDGIVPANFSSYNAPDKVHFNGAQSPVFRFDFGAGATIESLLATVDNNDNYLFRFFDGATLAHSVTITSGEGMVGFGVETFTRSFAPIKATHALVTASSGDNAYALGEVQFTGAAVAGVPEPASWAMMIGGFGMAGAAMRRRTPRAVLA